MLVGSPILLTELGDAVLQDAGHDSHRGLDRRVAFGGVENGSIVLFGLLQNVVVNRSNGGEALEIALGESPSGSAAGQEAGTVSLFVQRRQDKRNLVDSALEVGEGHHAGVDVDALDDDAHVLDHGALDHSSDADADSRRLLLEGRDEALGVVDLLRGAQPCLRGGLVVGRCHLEAGAVEGRQNGRSEHHSHHLADRVGGVDPVDAQEWPELESQSRLAGAAGPSDIDHQRSGQPVDSPNGSIAQSRLLALRGAPGDRRRVWPTRHSAGQRRFHSGARPRAP